MEVLVLIGALLIVYLLHLRARRRREALRREAIGQRSHFFPEPVDRGFLEARRDRAYTPIASIKNGLPITIEYADADGVITSRQITIRKVYILGNQLYIDTYCHLRRGDRTFRGDRILSLTPTGEDPVPDPIDFISSGEVALLQESPAHRSAMQRARPGLLTLAWIARADREIDDAEAKVMLEYVSARASLGRSRYGNEFDHDLARMRIDETTPVRGECVSALGAVRSGSREATLIAEFAHRIVSTGGEVDPAKERRRSQLAKAMG